VATIAGAVGAWSATLILLFALIVEDEVMIALGLQGDLEALGFEVSGLAANARQAMSLALSDKPDLVVHLS
jgi:YesN/AraC family two-component response regulator